MKIEFYDNLDYQLDAINSIVDIFKYQKVEKTIFGMQKRKFIGSEESEVGIGNRLSLKENELLENIQAIQKRNNLPLSQNLDKENLNFSVEMETGTGKTYVFLRTIFELNKNYNFKKFIIVVPSIAIKEGIKKNLDITKEHFLKLYDNVPYNYFIYNSDKLTQINEFARSDNIEIMIINIDAFNKDKNKINQPQEANLGEKPIELIAKTNPIVIIDEPQSVDSTEKAKNSIKTLNPLFILRYSATHKEKYNLMYKLDAVDAYEKKLVKQIEVASIKLSDTSNLPYIKFLSYSNKPIKAKIEIEILQNGKVQRKTKTIKGNDDLFEITKRDVYNGYLVREIYIEKGNEYIEFVNGKILRLGETIGEIDREKTQFLQIKKTIEEHLEKERLLLKKGIKVLSLFFIDRVANYRIYENGTIEKGKFVKFFETAFNNLINKPKFQELKESVYKNFSIDKIHDGYFSQDSKGKLKDTKGNSKADETTYEKIMKNKEKLLSLDEPLRFIFSHSALKEGWDNPNVFQICTLNETKSTMKKRQEIGRGLRICVDKNGKRVYGSDINRLTIIANESYEEFAKNLQKEYEEEGIKFSKKITIEDANKRKSVKLKKEVLLSEEFLELWNRIKNRTLYKIEFDESLLIQNCIKRIENEVTISKIRYEYEKANIDIKKEEINASDTKNRTEEFLEIEFELPNIVNILQEETNLKRKDIIEILTSINNLNNFKNNPQRFIEEVLQIIKEEMNRVIIDGIKYEKINNSEYAIQEIFDKEEIIAYLKNLKESQKSVYDYVVCDSEIEKNFVEEFNKSENIKLFAKLPPKFKIKTPVGAYNPDFAIVVEIDREEKLYFVLESKGSENSEERRAKENYKIECAKAHFKSLENGVKYVIKKEFKSFVESW